MYLFNIMAYMDMHLAGNLVSFLTLQLSNFFNLIGYEFTGVSIQSAKQQRTFCPPCIST